jgi:hypothetical protein
MKHLIQRTTSLTALLVLHVQPALAHDGHGFFGAHWHASDAFGFVAFALAVGAAVWISRK